MGKKTRKTKKTARQRAIKKADDAFSLYIRTRDKRCVLCGKETELTAGHLITRSRWSVRYDEDNVFCQCTSCNLKHEYYPEIFTAWYISRFGEKKYEELVIKSQQPKKYTTQELLELAEYYKEKTRKLLQGGNDGQNQS